MVKRPVQTAEAAALQTPVHAFDMRAIATSDLLLAVGNGSFLSHRLGEGEGEVVIGRDPGCDFVVDHPSLSRRHARLRIAEPPVVQDLGIDQRDPGRRGDAARR